MGWLGLTWRRLAISTPEYRNDGLLAAVIGIIAEPSPLRPSSLRLLVCLFVSLYLSLSLSLSFSLYLALSVCVCVCVWSWIAYCRTCQYSRVYFLRSTGAPSIDVPETIAFSVVCPSKRLTFTMPVFLLIFMLHTVAKLRWLFNCILLCLFLMINNTFLLTYLLLAYFKEF